MYTKPEDKMWQEQYDRWVNHMKPDEHFGLEFDKTPRPLIQKLGLHITDRKGVKEIKTSDPEYYGLAPWVSDDMDDSQPALSGTYHPLLCQILIKHLPLIT